MFNKEDLINANKRFATGKIVNQGSLEFAISSIKTKSWMDQVAYLIRALLVDHVFEDGNKRTAASVIAMYYTEFKIGFDPEKVNEILIKIIKQNINDITKIKRMIKNVTR